MSPSVRTVEQKLARLAGKAHGVVTHEQLLQSGITPAEIKWRLRTGALIRVHRGVYRVGHTAPSMEAVYLAAVLACGEAALLSGLATAHLLGLIRGEAPPPEVTAPTERRIKGVRTRRARAGMPEGIRPRGIPATSVAQTLVDIAAVLDDASLAAACHEAGVRFGTTPAEVRAILSKRPRSRGARKLKLAMGGVTPVALSRVESTFARRLRGAGLPLPVMNRPAGGRRVDCRWAEHRLTVELDSYLFHSSRQAWERDRRREREAYARGDQFRRYTWDDVMHHPRLMLRELRELLRSEPTS